MKATLPLTSWGLLHPVGLSATLPQASPGPADISPKNKSKNTRAL